MSGPDGLLIVPSGAGGGRASAVIHRWCEARGRARESARGRARESDRERERERERDRERER